MLNCVPNYNKTQEMCEKAVQMCKECVNNE